ncbi:MAG TPA: cytochrome c oxidase assembly protein [Arthrobacter sp.]|nr:cytochrome c oxidase assembly protein [Arthrobacter sp.]
MHEHGGFLLEAALFLPALVAVAAYLFSAASPRIAGGWPKRRSVFFVLGALTAVSTFMGPFAALSHQDFTANVGAHLLAGMVAPLFLVLSRPVTLALRTLEVVPARRLSALLKSRPARVLTDPSVAAVLNVGGMWVMYRTDLYQGMQESVLIHWLVMIHVLAAGYLFTAALVGRDPAPHRPKHAYRCAVLVASIAAHNILAKSLYAVAPTGIPADQAETGAQLMYYAGGAVELVLIILLWHQWYRTGARKVPGAVVRSPRTGQAA